MSSPPAPAPSRASAFVLGGAIASVLSLGMSLVRSKVSAAVVGPEGLGVMAEATQVVALGLVAGTAAAYTPLLRPLAAVARGSAEEDEAFASAWWATWVLHGLGALAVVGVTLGWQTEKWTITPWLAVTLCFVASFAAVLSTIGGQFLTVSGAVRKLTLTGILGALWATLFGVGMTLLAGVQGLFYGLALGAVANAVSTWLVVRRLRGSWPKLWPPRISRTFLRDSFTLGGTAIFGALSLQGYFSVTRSALSASGGLADNGQFQAAFTIATTYLTMVLSGLISYYPPRFAACADEHELQVAVDEASASVLRYLVPLSLLGIAASGPVIRVFYSSRFDPAIEVLELLLVAAPVRLLSWAWAVALPMRGKVRGFFVTEVGLLLVGAPLMVWLVERYGLRGAGLAYVALYVIYLPAVAWVMWGSLRVRPRAQHAVVALGVAAVGASVPLLSGGLLWWRLLVAVLGLVALWRSGLVLEVMARLNRLRSVSP